MPSDGRISGGTSPGFDRRREEHDQLRSQGWPHPGRDFCRGDHQSGRHRRRQEEIYVACNELFCLFFHFSQETIKNILCFIYLLWSNFLNLLKTLYNKYYLKSKDLILNKKKLHVNDQKNTFRLIQKKDKRTCKKHIFFKRFGQRPWRNSFGSKKGCKKAK